MVLVQTGPGVGNGGQMPRFVPVEELFKGRHFEQVIVVLCVRWYLSYNLISRDLVTMMAERESIWYTRPSCGGLIITLRSSKRDGAGSPERSEPPGAWTRPIVR
jgi:hypothetical protein